MVYQYRGGLKVPSWMVSDGTLRLTALTLPAYLNELKGIYLIEEPENGIHPRAVATVYDSLSSVYEAQVLLATHSPVVLNAADVGNVLCFAKDETGSTDIVLGAEHPRLHEWRGEANLGTLLAAGVLDGAKTPECVLVRADREEGFPAQMYGYSLPGPQGHSAPMVSARGKHSSG